MRILALGDIVGPSAVSELNKKFWSYRKENKIDFTVANGENASVGNGITTSDAKTILESGVDVITSGNHVWQKSELRSFLDDSKYIVRPMNYPSGSAGNGYTVVDCNGYRVLVMNISGTIYMESLSCPFECIERVLEREKGSYDVSILDIHAEATSEKLALARYFDGRIDCVFGTHTHVQTADEQILKGGTAYITDLGMCGPKESILGVKSDIIIKKLRTKMPQKFEFADGEIEFNGIIFDSDKKTIQRIRF